MKLAKALKVKNRIVGEANRVRGLISRENSKLDRDFNGERVESLFDELYNLTSRLVNIKAAIQTATIPIIHKLHDMSELKSAKAFLETLNTKSGPVYNHSTEAYDNYSAFYTQEKVDDAVVGIQQRIDRLQDEVDEFNAITEAAPTLD
jgi:hypothetical protein